MVLSRHLHKDVMDHNVDFLLKKTPIDIIPMSAPEDGC